MGSRALLFSKSPETNSALANLCENAGIGLEVCDDIFSAIEKGTKQAFGCVLVEWSCQPEAGFLLKRARESAANRATVAIAVVDHEPRPADIRDHRIDALIFRPIVPDEAREALTKALEKMPASVVDDAGEAAPGENSAHASRRAAPRNATPDDAEPHSSGTHGSGTDGSGRSGAAPDFTEEASDSPTDPSDSGLGDGAEESEIFEEEKSRRWGNVGEVLAGLSAVALALVAGVLLWGARDNFIYLARTPEGRLKVLRESATAFMHPAPLDLTPAPATDAPEAAAPSAGTSAPELQVVETGPAASESQPQLRKAAELPLPAPVFEPATQAAPGGRRNATIPESLRGSAPITPPVVVTVSPTQMMPVSAPSPPPAPQAVQEPVAVTEDAERALLVESANPTYPPEALPQKLHGAVVLQATIGRDGSVEDLKIVRGYFLLGKAAIAAVKQWQFKPYIFNGRPVRTQTMLTLNFDLPTS
ncbi:MAG: TonB family protein [Terriglobales bacterium]|jgi:protein TonB